MLVSGESMRSVAKQEGMSRNTLRKILTFEFPPGYGGRSLPESKWRPSYPTSFVYRTDTVRQQWMKWLYDLERRTSPRDSLEFALLGLERFRRKKVLAVIARRAGFSVKAIAEHLCLARTTVSRYVALFATGGLDALLRRRERARKADNEAFQKALFGLLHEPPALSGFNRTTWRMADLQATLAAKGFPIGASVIREAIKKAGFRWKSAKVVLTSTDPDYRAKLDRVQTILSHLGEDERFFSVDEYGPFAVRIRPGRLLVGPGETPSVPQRQKPKGWLIVTAALELSRNKVTHFYSPAKNTGEMIKMAETLLNEYHDVRTLYLSWDAAAWHMSKELLAFVDKHNVKADGTPRIELIPLPASAQFLNVIESVFSGMARAIIHNSDYASVEAAREAIDRYFEERNQHYAESPKRAGKKIWGKERMVTAFDPANNCKGPGY
jgi:transposase